MEKINEYIKEFNESTEKDENYLIRHLSERKKLLHAYYHEFYRVHHSLEAIEKRGHYFQEKYDRLEDSLPPLPEGKIPEDVIVEILKYFLSPDYKCKANPENIVKDVVSLISCLDYFVKRKVKSLPVNVVLALDIAMMDIVGNVATLKTSGVMAGIKRDKDKGAAKHQKATKNKRRDEKIKPEVIAALEKYLSENSARTIEADTLNRVIDKHIAPYAIYATGTIRKVIIDHYSEKGEKLPFKEHGAKKEKSLQ